MFTASRRGGKNVGQACGAKRQATLAKEPCPRDLRAFQLAAQGLSQRQVARHLGCSQPTVLRAIARTSRWIATLVPDPEEEWTWVERFRVAAAKHQIMREHESRMAENEAS